MSDKRTQSRAILLVSQLPDRTKPSMIVKKAPTKTSEDAAPELSFLIHCRPSLVDSQANRPRPIARIITRQIRSFLTLSRVCDTPKGEIWARRIRRQLMKAVKPKVRAMITRCCNTLGRMSLGHIRSPSIRKLSSGAWSDQKPMNPIAIPTVEANSDSRIRTRLTCRLVAPIRRKAAYRFSR